MYLKLNEDKFHDNYDEIVNFCNVESYDLPKVFENSEISKKYILDDEAIELKQFITDFPQFKDIIKFELNHEQEEAVRFDNTEKDNKKFLSIEAGPGAGKTRVLIEKVEYMVNELNVNPESLLIITFSNKAAQELQERLADGELLRSDVQKMHISTIHSFCGQILEDEGYIGLNLISDDAGEKNLLFIGKHMKELGFVNEAYMSNGDIPDIADKYNEYCTFGVKTDELIKYIKENKPVSEEYVNFVREYMEEHDGKYPYDEVKENEEFKDSKYNARYLQIANSYPIYEEILKREKAIDFAHMQKDALEIVKKENFKTQFTNILIDEFQDTDPIQFELFEGLMKTADSLTVVGDINQSIYGFRGSNINPFDCLHERHENEFEFKSLPTNYRSTQEIIDISEDFIKHQRSQDSALGKSACGREINNRNYFLVNDFDKRRKKSEPYLDIEAKDIVKIIKHLIDKNKINKLSDIGILFRSIRPSSSRCIEFLLNELNDNEIDYQLNTNDLMEQPEIKSILTLFFHLVAEDDPHKYRFNKWEREWLNLNAYADQILFELSDETKDILYNLQSEFEDNVVQMENEIWRRDHKRGGKNSFAAVFKDRPEEMLVEIFENVTRPVLTDENLEKYGITNQDDLEFFHRLNAFKESLYSEDVKFYERPTVSEVYLKLLTDITGFLTEDYILDIEKENVIYNLSQITSSISTFVEVRFERDIRGAFWFIYRTIEGHSSYMEEKDAVQIMTIHKSKGLEFPVVIIPSFNQDEFPKKYDDPSEKDWIHGNPVYFTPDDCLKYPKFDKKYTPEESHVREEERVIYVGMTRAEDVLILSSLVENVSAAKNEAIEWGETEDLPKGPACIEKAINVNLDTCELIDTDDIDIQVLPREIKEESDDYCIDLSFTALENYNNCPFKYNMSNKFGFIVSEKKEIDEGIFVHHILEVINKEIINNDNVFIGEERVKEIILDLFEKSNQELKEEDPAEYEKQLNEVMNNILEYYSMPGEDAILLDSEYPFYLKDENYALSGVIDLIYEKDGKLGIIDYKNTRLEGKYKDKFKKQLHLYVLALRDQNQQYFGKEISELKVYALKSKKFVDVPIDEDYIEELKAELVDVASKIHEGKFESSKCDDCKYCPYSNICNQKTEN